VTAGQLAPGTPPRTCAPPGLASRLAPNLTPKPAALARESWMPFSLPTENATCHFSRKKVAQDNDALCWSNDRHMEVSHPHFATFPLGARTPAVVRIVCDPAAPRWLEENARGAPRLRARPPNIPRSRAARRHAATYGQLPLKPPSGRATTPAASTSASTTPSPPSWASSTTTTSSGSAANTTNPTARSVTTSRASRATSNRLHVGARSPDRAPTGREIAELRCAGFTVNKGVNALALGIAAVSCRLENGTLRILPGACPRLLAEAELDCYSTDPGRRRADSGIK
jgi:hypothetical protein